jgi:hypothetical protein
MQKMAIYFTAKVSKKPQKGQNNQKKDKKTQKRQIFFTANRFALVIT